MRERATTFARLGCLTVLGGCLVLGLASEAHAAIPTAERAALIALYNSTNGAGWYSRANWRNGEDTDFSPVGSECTWAGVTCDGSESNVSTLLLDWNNLSGRIPPEIGNFSGLRQLELARNSLTGPIPPEIGNLTNLIELSLDLNQLSGPIPPEIGNLANVWILELCCNRLSGAIPPEIGNLTDVWILGLFENELSGPIPPEIGRLSNLSSLGLDHNQLSGPIPHEIGSLTRLLGSLGLRGNQLTGPIPPEIGNLRAQNLDLGSNQLSGPIPPEIGKLSSLTTLYLDHNQLSGPIPHEIGNIGYVEELHLEYNQLSGPIPPEIGHLTMGAGTHHAGTLRLDHNQLSGPIPPEIGDLYMGGTELSGSVHLEYNRLTGPIPPTICNVKFLGLLSLNNNRLTGPIPRQIGSLTHLFELDLADNQLTGPIPPEIGSLARLDILRLQGNQLRGLIPTTLANLTALLDGSSDLRWNALYTNDAALRAFLDSKQIGGDWESTQTVAPTGLAAGPQGPDSVPLRWTPILYIGDTGGYRSWYGTIPGGPYNLAGMTTDKATGAFSVSGLSPGTTYYFTLDTVTEPHADNQNTVVSERTAEVSATTLAGGAGWHGLTVVTNGPGTVTSSPGGIVCGGACFATFAPGTPVTLTAVPDAGSNFLGWGGACAGMALTCDLTMDSAQTVTASFSSPAVSFYTVTPCRLYDSRDAGLGGLAAGTDNAVLVRGYCSVPPTAKAVSLNVTAVSATASGHLRLYASGTPRPMTSSINYAGGQTRANNAVVSLGADGALIIYVNQPSGTVHVVIDVNGYFQ